MQKASFPLARLKLNKVRENIDLYSLIYDKIPLSEAGLCFAMSTYITVCFALHAENLSQNSNFDYVIDLGSGLKFRIGEAKKTFPGNSFFLPFTSLLRIIFKHDKYRNIV